LITLALLGAIAARHLVWQDPSLSHATQTPVHNLAWFPGRGLLRSRDPVLGLASIMLLRRDALGWRLLSHRPVGENGAACCGSSPLPGRRLCLHAPPSAPGRLPTGLGGVFSGDAMLRAPR